jgi:hypothetical protein
VVRLLRIDLHYLYGQSIRNQDVNTHILRKPDLIIINRSSVFSEPTLGRNVPCGAAIATFIGFTCLEQWVPSPETSYLTPQRWSLFFDQTGRFSAPQAGLNTETLKQQVTLNAS